MKAARFNEFTAPLEIVDLPRPEPSPGGVVIKVEAAGLCRSDWHGWQGHDADIKALPHTPGHEFSGTIAALGEGVEGWEIGDRVTAPFVCGCGRCAQCASGNSQVCPDQYQPGFTGPGAFAEFVALPFAQHNLVRLPATIDFASAASLGCRFATAFRALAHADQADVGPGERVAIFGCGGVGLSAVMIAKALGAHVIAIDIREEPLTRALSIGADEALHFEDTTDLAVDVSVDALGSTPTCLASIEALAPRGRQVQIGLMVGDHARPEIPMGKVVAKELKLIGSHGMAAASYPEMLGMIADGQFDPSALIAERIPLTEVPEALAKMGGHEGTPGVTLIDASPYA